ncbi:MAG: hypothetical protein ABI716_03010 [Candidatus Saccharibacteria bacterium]
MDETIGDKHLQAVDRMFKIANNNAKEAANRLTEQGHIRRETLLALELYLDISLDRDNGSDAKNRHHLAAAETLGSSIGDTLSRSRAVRIGKRIALVSLWSARQAAMIEGSFDSQN